MTASLDLVQISNTYGVCVRESAKNIFKPDPKGRKRQASPKDLSIKCLGDIYMMYIHL